MITVKEFSYILQEDSIFAMPEVPVRRPGLHSKSLRILALSFEQNCSILWIYDVNTLIVTNFLPK